VQQQIQKVDPHRLVVCGFLDDDPAKRAGHSDILGPLDDVVSVVLKERVQHIIMALPPRAYDRMMQLTGDLHRLPVHVWVIPDYFRLALHKTRIEDFGGIPMLDLRAPALSESQRMLKRAFDIIVSVISLPVAAPLIGLSAAAVWLETGRPVFFWQWRAGENGRMFRMLKLRTMRHTTGEAQPPLSQDGPHKAPQDPRVTRVGRFLRRTSLDELPQLYNVLRGEMSLVGPRPELPELVNRYETWQRQRFSVPQGITGWWQVNGRSDRPMHLHTEDDLYYVQNYSMILDLYILIKTVVVVLRGKGAF
jgi:exopolysaccharide biosynthesis polyprenyl glycosylphosphotransferase